MAKEEANDKCQTGPKIKMSNGESRELAGSHAWLDTTRPVGTLSSCISLYAPTP